ncbi:MAG TPA: hypothetical protein VFH51_02000, partial [Myxococcota bacterium]|nr:hypothetical protein [Myxococcota bacterium]
MRRRRHTGSPPQRWAALRRHGRALLLTLLAACSRAPRAAGTYPVGVTTASFLEPEAGRPLTTEIWYPAPDTAVEEEQLYR